ncbi:hypothetical protein GKE73_01395 [Paludibacterium sp. dN 18-1]|uniref:3'-5' exoribonuclease Rv2179c-like domain-containing protein n=1 Tax=Paludibacterium denitrificans TaxID=2675226 RepID=A0A844GAR4_9NEIS|nr:3'-5' exoribonuclease [Paludibacterium denitrificans]MTD32440.1 hypothetical protein [Paludibacterium denitrificans]
MNTEQNVSTENQYQLRKHCMKPQIVIDTETLDVQPSAAILTVAAVEIDPSKFDDAMFRRSFYARIALPQPTRTLSQDTANWWKEQSEAAHAEAFAPEGREELSDVVTSFNTGCPNRMLRSGVTAAISITRSCSTPSDSTVFAGLTGGTAAYAACAGLCSISIHNALTRPHRSRD